MRALIQRVTEASVTVDDRNTGAIGPGLVILLGVSKEDDEDDAKYLVDICRQQQPIQSIGLGHWGRIIGCESVHPLC